MDVKMEYCYDGGNLARAMRQAAEFIAKQREGDVIAVLTSFADRADITAADIGWTVIVVYRPGGR